MDTLGFSREDYSDTRYNSVFVALFKPDTAGVVLPSKYLRASPLFTVNTRVVARESIASIELLPIPYVEAGPLGEEVFLSITGASEYSVLEVVAATEYILAPLNECLERLSGLGETLVLDRYALSTLRQLSAVIDEGLMMIRQSGEERPIPSTDGSEGMCYYLRKDKFNLQIAEGLLEVMLELLEGYEQAKAICLKIRSKLRALYSGRTALSLSYLASLEVDDYVSSLRSSYTPDPEPPYILEITEGSFPLLYYSAEKEFFEEYGLRLTHFWTLPSSSRCSARSPECIARTLGSNVFFVGGIEPLSVITGTEDDYTSPPSELTLEKYNQYIHYTIVHDQSVLEKTLTLQPKIREVVVEPTGPDTVDSVLTYFKDLLSRQGRLYTVDGNNIAIEGGQIRISQGSRRQSVAAPNPEQRIWLGADGLFMTATAVLARQGEIAIRYSPGSSEALVNLRKLFPLDYEVTSRLCHSPESSGLVIARSLGYPTIEHYTLTEPPEWYKRRNA